MIVDLVFGIIEDCTRFVQFRQINTIRIAYNFPNLYFCSHLCPFLLRKGRQNHWTGFLHCKKGHPWFFPSICMCKKAQQDAGLAFCIAKRGIHVFFRPFARVKRSRKPKDSAFANRQGMVLRSCSCRCSQEFSSL